MTVISPSRRQKLQVHTADEKEGRTGGIVEPLRLFWTVSRILRCDKSSFPLKPGFFVSLFLVLTHGVKRSFNWASIRLVLGSNSDADTFVTLVNCVSPQVWSGTCTADRSMD